MKDNYQIGDWVECGINCTGRITQMGGMLMCVRLSNGDLIVETDKVKPIPLTPEILEKNGFKKGFLPALKTESSLLWVANVGEDYIEIRFDRRNIAIWYDYDENGDGVYSDCLLPLPYWLHELQHALRLCGIDKEIEI